MFLCVSLFISRKTPSLQVWCLDVGTVNTPLEVRAIRTFSKIAVIYSDPITVRDRIFSQLLFQTISSLKPTNRIFRNFPLTTIEFSLNYTKLATFANKVKGLPQSGRAKYINSAKQNLTPGPGEIEPRIFALMP